MKIRTLEADEVSLHRELRIRALNDSPHSFAETGAEAEARPFSYWEDLTRSVTAPDRHVMFVAFESDAIVGTTYGLLDNERKDVGRIGGMWVAALQRRRGVGRALLAAVLVWARERGLKRVSLWAPASESAAVALYSRAGFKDTGRQRPLPTNAELRIIEMEIDL
jgi:GNAT superfamily N-acetyltransferase